ncbi:hypothetical protein VTK26DRAFT_659 [Humicola hyalothermophila]
MDRASTSSGNILPGFVGAAQLQPSRSDDRKARYAYMFKAGKRRFLYVGNLSFGVDSRAQLVEDLETGEILVRKVHKHRPQDGCLRDGDRQPKPPAEIQLQKATRKRMKAPERGHPVYIAECYGHEYIEPKDTGGISRGYHSVSYWKFYNGGSVYSRWMTGQVTPPVVAVARMLRQVFGTLQYLYTSGGQPVYHGSLHFGNIWLHWTDDALLPDFYLGDFADATFADSMPRGWPDGHDEGVRDQPGLAGRAIRDLHVFWCDLWRLTSKLVKSRNGIASEVLKRITDALGELAEEWKAKTDVNPPDLTNLIALSRHLEVMCKEGGRFDETRTRAFLRFVSEERDLARKVGTARAWINYRTKEDVLHPKLPPSIDSVVLQGCGTWCHQGLGGTDCPEVLDLHGPWHLVQVSWVASEPDGVAHHLPNGPYADLLQSGSSSADGCDSISLSLNPRRAHTSKSYQSSTELFWTPKTNGTSTAAFPLPRTSLRVILDSLKYPDPARTMSSSAPPPVSTLNEAGVSVI